MVSKSTIAHIFIVCHLFYTLTKHNIKRNNKMAKHLVNLHSNAKVAKTFPNETHPSSSELMGKKPTPEKLEYGEIAVNYAADTETINIKNSNDEIVGFLNENVIYENEYIVAEAIADLHDKKQNKLVAGDNIDITNDVISATGLVDMQEFTEALSEKQDALTVGDNIEIDENNVISANIDLSNYATTDQLGVATFPYEKQYMTFVTLENCTFTFTKYGTGDDIQYSTDNGVTWNSLVSGTGRIQISPRKTVMWKATLLPSSEGIGFFNSTGDFKVEGNIMSLIHGDDFIGQTSLENKNLVFCSLFTNNNHLTDASNFILPATTLSYGCYMGMFFGCGNLTAAPELPAALLTNQCYASLFQGCRYLNYIKMLATNVSAPECLTNWVSGVAASGTFVKDCSATWDIIGVDGVPSNWDIKYNYNIIDEGFIDLGTFNTSGAAESEALKIKYSANPNIALMRYYVPTGYTGYGFITQKINSSTETFQWLNWRNLYYKRTVTNGTTTGWTQMAQISVNDFNNKQNKLTAGSNISIDNNNVISVDTTYLITKYSDKTLALTDINWSDLMPTSWSVGSTTLTADSAGGAMGISQPMYIPATATITQNGTSGTMVVKVSTGAELVSGQSCNVMWVKGDNPDYFVEESGWYCVGRFGSLIDYTNSISIIHIDTEEVINNKQDKLIAGSNIQIDNNVISATDTTYTAGSGISIQSNNTIQNTFYEQLKDWSFVVTSQYLDLSPNVSTLELDESYTLFDTSTIPNYNNKITTAKYIKANTKIKITWNETSTTAISSTLFIASSPKPHPTAGTQITIVAVNNNAAENNLLEYVVTTDGYYVLGYSDLIMHSTVEITLPNL